MVVDKAPWLTCPSWPVIMGPYDVGFAGGRGDPGICPTETETGPGSKAAGLEERMALIRGSPT